MEKIGYDLIRDCPYLKRIRLHHANDKSLQRLPEYWPNITEIELQYDYRYKSLNYLLERCPKLESIYIHGQKFSQNNIMVL